jgi:hypothetical protein
VLRWARRDGEYRVTTVPLSPTLEHGEPNVKIIVS